jgi:aquaporin TIP
MKVDPRPLVAEFIGTFALTFVGGAAIINGYVGGTATPLIDVAVAHGLILALLVSATMRVSGHLNPAVTIGIAVTRRISPSTAVMYIVSQCLGAVVAAMALKALYPTAAAQAARMGGQFVATHVSTMQAISFEAIATFFLVFVVFGTAVDPKGPKVGGFAIGLTIAADILAIGPATGGSMNPARSFGPAVVSGVFEGHLVYWIGPIAGAIVAGLVYDRVFLRGEGASGAAEA